VLFLHGGGERGSDNEKQLVHGASLFLKNENRKDYPCIVVFPQCPADSYWGSARIDRSKTPIIREFNYAESEITEGLRLALDLTKSLMKNEAVDTNRVYVTGLSMGGMGTFEAVWREPDLFAAAAPICGGGDVKAYGEKPPKIPFWIFHGAVDGVVQVDFSRQMNECLRASGVSVKYTEYPAVNHNSWDYAFVEENFLKWLFSQRKGGAGGP
jgi:predicted peptidase